MSQSIIQLEMLVGGPFKKSEIDNWIYILNSYVEEKEGYYFKLSDHYYVDKKSLDSGLFLFLVLSAVADAFTICMALRELVRRESRIQDLEISTDRIKIKIKGNMTNEEIINILKEGKEIE